MFIETSHEGINTFWFNNGDTYTDYGYYLIPFVVAGILMVRASFAFKMLPAAPIVVNDNGIHQEAATVTDYADSIAALAALVSRPEDIGDMVDDIRFATVSIRSDSSLSSQDKDRLLKIYHQLETYLTKKDPVRTFTKQQVLERVTPPFRLIVEKSAI